MQPSDFMLYLTLLMVGSAMNAGVSAFSNVSLDKQSLRGRFHVLLMFAAICGLVYLTT